MDESGIDSKESSPYGWCKKGQRFQAQRPGFGRERLSLMGALCQEKFLAPMVVQGYCT
ncbi:MAG: IS630 family transposase, partial [Cyanobacteria bacterium QH_8_48_120]